MQTLNRLLKLTKDFDSTIFYYKSDILKVDFYSEEYLELESFTITSMTIYQCYCQELDVKNNLNRYTVETLAKMAVTNITFSELAAMLNVSITVIKNAIYDSNNEAIKKQIDSCLDLK